jgi:RimJ/RimL family protein N-acetyltransferase
MCSPNGTREDNFLLLLGRNSHPAPNMPDKGAELAGPDSMIPSPTPSPPITLPPTYLSRLTLRTQLPSDLERVTEIFNNPTAMRHLSGLAPPGGWTEDRIRGLWHVKDIAARVELQELARARGETLALVIIWAETDELVGITGYARMEPPGTPGRKAELGIITDVNLISSRGWKSLGTEALHATSKYAFEQLGGVEEITLVTQEQNEEMRGWSEKVAGLTPTLTVEEWGHVAWYAYTRKKWETEGGVRDRLEAKLARWKA